MSEGQHTADSQLRAARGAAAGAPAPDGAAAWSNLARLLYELGRYEEAGNLS